MADRTAGMLGRYRLIEKIGEGGMGVVWRATDPRLDREIAIKVLPERFSADPDRLARLEREARILAGLDHPSIVTIFSIEEDAGVRFLTMELVRGRTLDAVVPAGGLPLADLVRIGDQLLDAVASAHELGLTHRDLKPANIMVRPDGRVKVLDFGLARSQPPPREEASSQASTVTDVGEPGHSGTPSYMAPEQIQGLPADPRADVFALGIVLYLMASGRHPFRAATPLATAAAILRDEPPPLAEARPDLSGGLVGLIEDCLSKDPDRRPVTAAVARAALRAAGDVARAVGSPIPSVAVLPFSDLSREQDQAYFCEGIAAEIINTLSRVAGLRVASRISSFHLRTAELDVGEIGRRLGVRTVLEGSVRKAGRRLCVTTELTDTAGGFCLWSERFEREARDIFAIQEEIARSIVLALQVDLSPSEHHAIAHAPGRDPDAYDFYLRGRQHFAQFSRHSVALARQMFERALEIDPDYALAWAGISDCHAYDHTNAWRTEEDRERALAAGLRATELGPERAQTHVSYGVALSLNCRHEEAETQFETALRLEPRLFEAHYFYARDAFAQGHLEKAVHLYEQALRLNPEDYQAPLLAGQIYDDLGRPADAEQSRREGVRIAAERLKRDPGDIRALYMGANGFAMLGEKARALEWTAAALRVEPDDPMVLYNVACVESLAGRPEEAVEHLERAVEEGLRNVDWIAHDSNLDAIRSHARFPAIMRRVDELRRAREQA